MKTITIEMPDDKALPFADTDEQFARALSGSPPQSIGTSEA